jgi:hypothetical protein
MYSTGSSAVRMRISGRCSFIKQAYTVVDLPDPVGPVTRKTPAVCLSSSPTRAETTGDRSSSAIERGARVRSRMRMTTLSPE